METVGLPGRPAPFPIVRYGWSDEASMAADNTSAFNYRLIAGTDRLSRHATGRALDINPRRNPAVYPDGRIAPAGAVYRPGSPGTFTGEHPVVLAFRERGWRWGGDFTHLQDYHHFEKRASGKRNVLMDEPKIKVGICDGYPEIRGRLNGVYRAERVVLHRRVRLPVRGRARVGLSDAFGRELLRGPEIRLTAGAVGDLHPPRGDDRRPVPLGAPGGADLSRGSDLSAGGGGDSCRRQRDSPWRSISPASSRRR